MKVLYIPVSPTSTSLPNTVHVLVQAPPNFPYSYQNIKFYHPSVGPIPSWYEGNGIWFVKVPAGVPLQSLYAVVFDNPVLDGQTVGVSPYVQLGYDNGQNVFNLYTNFQFDNPEIDKWVVAVPGFLPRNIFTGAPASLALNINILTANVYNKPNTPTVVRNDGPTEYNQVVEISTNYLLSPSVSGFDPALVFQVALWGTQLTIQFPGTQIPALYAPLIIGGTQTQQGGTSSSEVSPAIAVITDASLVTSFSGYYILPQPSTPLYAYVQMYFLQNAVYSYSTTSSSNLFTTGIYNTNNLTQNFTYQQSQPFPADGSLFMYSFGRYPNVSWGSSDFIYTYWLRVRGVLPNGQTPIGQIQLPMP
ncbi:MAG: hypothetical protein QXF82_04345 [Nitrososphaeria archaeon]